MACSGLPESSRFAGPGLSQVALFVKQACERALWLSPHWSADFRQIRTLLTGMHPSALLCMLALQRRLALVAPRFIRKALRLLNATALPAGRSNAPHSASPRTGRQRQLPAFK